jgi:hypothetical protein
MNSHQSKYKEKFLGLIAKVSSPFNMSDSQQQEMIHPEMLQSPTGVPTPVMLLPTAAHNVPPMVEAAAPGPSPHDPPAPQVFNPTPMEPQVLGPGVEIPQVGGLPQVAAMVGQLPPAEKRPRPSSSPSRKPPSKKSRHHSRDEKASWNDNLFQLLKFKAEHGHVEVPESHPLYHWVYAQRRNKRQKDWRQHNGKESSGKNKLTQDHINVLNQVGFTWDPYKKAIDEKWKQRFDELVGWKDIHGHCNVPQKSDQKELSSWVKVQRMNYTHAQRQKAGHKLPSDHCVALSQERIDMLESIGFEWRVKKAAQGWDARFAQLLEYKQANGNTLVPFNYVDQNGRLGRWVNKQRHEMTLKLRGEKSQLTDDREARLNEIGFRWVAPGFQKKSIKGWNPNDYSQQGIVTGVPQDVLQIPVVPMGVEAPPPVGLVDPHKDDEPKEQEQV